MKGIIVSMCFSAIKWVLGSLTKMLADKNKRLEIAEFIASKTNIPLVKEENEVKFINMILSLISSFSGNEDAQDLFLNEIMEYSNKETPEWRNIKTMLKLKNQTNNEKEKEELDFKITTALNKNLDLVALNENVDKIIANANKKFIKTMKLK